ncbi:MAG: thiamine-phosphate kinase [Methanosarcinales archaeon]|nr:thiamine-phosphate kinase [Methanosarcinales archaeon]
MPLRCSELGERGLIKRLTEILGGVENDDCALLEVGEGYIVATTDMLHRQTDFPAQASPWQIGWMSVAVNLSDVAAMGALPLGLLMAAGIPTEMEVEQVEEIFRGMDCCARACNTRIIGGDTDAHQELTLNGTALGTVERDRVLRRRGARPGDLLCTTGALGGAGAGLELLLERDWRPGQPGEDLARRLLEPQPRLKEGRALALSGAATAMMDNSDGLALSLSDLAEAGKTGFVVRQESLPRAAGLEAWPEEESLDLMLFSGGDFELLFTLCPEKLAEARQACPFTAIGYVVEEGLWLEDRGARRLLPTRGFEHMRSRPGS